jgi:hypothetical protein
MALLKKIQSLLLVLLALGLFANLSIAADKDTSRTPRMADEIPDSSDEVPEGEPFLYYLNYELGSSGTVERAPLDDATASEQLVQIPEYQTVIHGIATNVELDRIFYTTGHGSPNESSVWEASLKGEDPEQLYRMEMGPDPDPGAGFSVIESLGGEEGTLVWLDTWARRIWIGTASGEAPTYYEFQGREWTYVGNLYGLAIDQKSSVALVSEWEHSRIYEVTPDGEISLWMDQSTNESFFHPAAMAIDPGNRLLYWIQHNGLWRTSLDSRFDDEHLYEFHDGSLMGGLALDLQDEVAYWAQDSFREINRAKMDGTSEAPEQFISFPSLHSAHGMTIAYIPTPEPGAAISALAILFGLGVLRTRRPLDA